MGMEADGDTGEKVPDFMKEPLDDLSIDELAERIENLRLEVSRCETEIEAKNSTKETAESVFRK
jgi:uncharacterized small protein (DUF1192 family)